MNMENQNNNMAYSNISITELDKTSRELINDLEIQEIHQLVAELDSGVKHSESKDLQVKQWFEKTDAYIQHLIGEGTSIFGLHNFMREVCDNQVGYEIMEARFALARHYISRKEFAKQFKYIKKGLSDFIHDFYFEIETPNLAQRIKNEPNTNLNYELSICGDSMLYNVVRITENKSFRNAVFKRINKTLEKHDYHPAGKYFSVNMFPKEWKILLDIKREETQHTTGAYLIQSNEPFLHNPVHPYEKLYAYFVTMLQQEEYPNVDFINCFVKDNVGRDAENVVHEIQSLWFQSLFEKDYLSETVGELSRVFAERLNELSSFLAPTGVKLHVHFKNDYPVIKNAEVVFPNEEHGKLGKRIRVEDSCIFLDENVISEKLNRQNLSIDFETDEVVIDILTKQKQHVKQSGIKMPEQNFDNSMAFLQDRKTLLRLSNSEQYNTESPTNNNAQNDVLPVKKKLKV